MKVRVSIQRVNSETYLELCYTSKMEYFPNIVNYCKALNFFAKHSILDVWQGSEYASETCASAFPYIRNDILYGILQTYQHDS